MRKVCVILVDRANYGRLQPVMWAIQSDPRLDLQLVCGGSTVLSRFGNVADEIERDGFTVNERLWHEVEGSTPETMARGVGLGVIEYTGALQRLNPDIVLLIGDRSEALAAAIAAAYSNRTLVHIQGGEVSGSIDESARHAISKLAHFHVPATERAAQYLIRMGERPETILTVGCPASDLASDVCEYGGLRNHFLCVFHPTTTEFGSERHQMEQVLDSLNTFGRKTLLLWPNADAGSSEVMKAIRVFRDKWKPEWLMVQTNYSPQSYLSLLASVGVCIGNSSSFIRDAGFFGTPVVLVGSRQDGRECGENVIRVRAFADEIVPAIREQIAHGRYPASTLYGDGHVSERIVEALVNLKPYKQKRLSYSDQPKFAKALEDGTTEAFAMIQKAMSRSKETAVTI